MIRKLMLLLFLYCAAAPSYGSVKKIEVDSWGHSTLTYSAAKKRIHFHILIPRKWRTQDCVFYPRWILQDKSITGNDPGPGLPSRQAVGIMLKGNSTYLIMESPYLKNLSENDNWHGMYWIVGSGYFTKAINEPGGGGRIGHRGGTNYAILTSDPSKSNLTQFEKSLH